MRAWTEIGFSSIYRLLKKFEKEGLIVGEPGESEGRGPARVIYRMTEPGWEVWKEASLIALGSPSITDSAFLLGLDNLFQLDPTQALQALRTNLERLNLSRNYLQDHLAERGEMHFYMEAFFDYLITMFQAKIDWTDKFVQDLEAYIQNEETEP
jgi:DNA-binding PadR family transcriptional regulator